MTNQTWGDERSMETPATPVGGRTDIGGNGARNRAMDKGTETTCYPVTFGDTIGDFEARPADYKLTTPIMHGAGRRGIESNTNPGKGIPLPHNTVEFGSEHPEALDNDDLTGDDGDDNDIAARYVSR